ncbi:AAA family ATPase [Burkholderia pseudomallei]|uniref:ATP-binding protein n=1 Tax=Burkholderia pseudomallei TaxID=28450 RepID=UPI001AD61D25|nr:ATP-binding protein [Burkholderia pseudomallei]MBO7776716.1 AAA family ATPase [Burkholderia pseudomallei]MBO7909604.1 AAA family ATPase [Burkholderia pseudomallei]
MKNTFVAGVHAVGKTYLCKPAAESGEWVHASASSLIKQELGRENWTDDKRVADADRNQQALIAAVKRINDDGKRLLLDGHFVLRSKDDEFVLLGADVFADLNLDAVIHIVAPARLIAERLYARDGVARIESDIEAFQDAERRQAELVCAELGLRLVVLDTPTEQAFADALAG